MDGAQDLPGFLVQHVGAPVGIELLQLSDQPVVLSQEECVQRDHPQVLVSSGITCNMNVTVVTIDFLSDLILNKVQDSI